MNDDPHAPLPPEGAHTALGRPGGGMTAALAGSPAGAAALVAALADPALHGRDCRQVTVLETHISWVLLTGTHAYKLKKPVALGFLDFSTLEARRHYCEEELRLNRRLAPELYLEVVPITGTPAAPRLGGDGPAIEWAVKMREFPQQALLPRVLERGELTAADVDTLAELVAAFHARVAVAGADSRFGTPQCILHYALENFVQIEALPEALTERAALDALAAWTREQHAALSATFQQRLRDGFVRECHGDLHLGNMAQVAGRLVIFDCLEFNAELRWIDVMSEVAFTVMDLEDRGRPDLARRFLNAWLERSGDYAGLAVLRFYFAYRAMVRAKVAALRAHQMAEGAARDALLAEHRGYLALALAMAQAAPPRPALIVTHGPAGSGKTTLAQALVAAGGVIRLRSDVERKRLHGLGALARSRSAVAGGLYAQEATRATYQRLRDLAREIIVAGCKALVDATCLARWQREMFRDLAAELGVPFVIVAATAREASLRERVVARGRHGRDASEADLAVLEHQLRHLEPLSPDEQACVVVCDTDAPLDGPRATALWQRLAARWEAPGAIRTGAPATPGAGPPQAGGSPLGGQRSVGAHTPDPGLAAKLAFLSDPAAYPGGTGRVDTVETHMSWVFLAGDRAFKLRKPVRTAWLDFSTVEARRRDCAEEVRLNRRLTHDVYLGTVPLTVGAGQAGSAEAAPATPGALSLGGSGSVVDWLVQMRRLPAGRMLDQAIRDGTAGDADLRRVAAALVEFYRAAEDAALSAEEYRRRLHGAMEADLRELSAWPDVLPGAEVQALIARQRSWIECHAGLFDERVRAGHVVDAHGDLRPEHICLTDPPQIIDCLEFSRDLRLQDSAGEMAFLALECERLGAPQVGARVLALYRELSADDAPAALIHFHQSHHACQRARVTLWHLSDPAHCHEPRWPARAKDYLRLALAHVEAATRTGNRGGG